METKMSENNVEQLMNGYKKRAEKKKQNMQEPKPMSLDQLTKCVMQLSNIIEALHAGRQQDSSKFNTIYDVLLDLEMSINATSKALNDKNIVNITDIGDAKKELQREYKEAVEKQFDEKNGLTVVDKPVENGLSVLIKVDAFDDSGVKLDKLSVEKLFINSVGGGELIPVVESELIGMKAGESKTFDKVLGEDFNVIPELKDKTIKFTLFVYSVKEKEVKPDFVPVEQEEVPQT
jgi:hypothetical protein